MTSQLPSQPALQVLCHDGPVIVVNKPAGVLTQAPPGIDSLEIRVRAYVKQLEGKPGNIYLGVPHRLDRPVSGAVVFGRHVRATRRLAAQFEARTVRKVYLALVEGAVTPPEGVWRDHLQKLPGRAAVEVVAEDHAGGKIAELSYRVVDNSGRQSLLEIIPATGRTHQIRVQAATRGWPVCGDQQYGSRQAFGPPAADPRERAIALHALELGFRHPMKEGAMHVRAPLPLFWGPSLAHGPHGGHRFMR